MKWTQLAVIISLAIQQTCAIETHLDPNFLVLDGDAVETNRDTIDDFNTKPYSYVMVEPEHDHRIYSTLYNAGGNHSGDKKIIKVVKFVNTPTDLEQKDEGFNDQGIAMEKRQVPEGMPKPTKPAGASGSLAGASTKSKVRFGGKGGKVAAGIGLAAIATGATIGAVAHHQMKNKDRNESSQMMKRQDLLDKPFEKRKGKGKAALLVGGGMAAGALAMHHFSKPAGPTAADPNAPQPPPAK